MFQCRADAAREVCSEPLTRVRIVGIAVSAPTRNVCARATGRT
ncbi:MAG: hypothetical protein QOE16_2323, partial [Microbacteriaceae bacterium]|nr:hypothetical protein [Microbacteriaceae bacterium]